MHRPRSHTIAIVLAGLLIVGLWTTVPATGEAVSRDGGDHEWGASVFAQDETPVEVEIDCNRSEVDVTAPEGYQYDLTVTVANLTATSNEISRSTVGSVEGNETVEFADEGVVFVFVEGESDDEPVAVDVTNCSGVGSEANTTVQPDDAPEIRINCTENEVRFVGFEGREYDARVVAMGISPTRSSTSSVAQTLEGNVTVSVDEDALVAAFASTGDGGTISAIRNCSPYGPERIPENASDAGDRDDGLEEQY